MEAVQALVRGLLQVVTVAAGVYLGFTIYEHVTGARQSGQGMA